MAEMANLILKLIDINSKVLKKIAKLEKNLFIVRKQVLEGCHKYGDHPIDASSNCIANVLTCHQPEGFKVETEAIDLKKSHSIKSNPKCVLTEHDWIIEAFYDKFKTEYGKNWHLKENDWNIVVNEVNKRSCEDWTMVEWGVQSMMIQQNLIKANKKVPDYDPHPMDNDSAIIIENWVASKY